MAVKKYRKQPVVIEAIQFVGNNYDEIFGFVPKEQCVVDSATGALLISTTEGVMVGSQNDWIIKGIKGEFYPCKPDIFAATYQEVSE